MISLFLLFRIETTTTTTTRLVLSSSAMSRGRIGQEEAPKFSQPLKSVSVKDGQAATLQAEVKGQFTYHRAENQKGINAIQQCAIENQKGDYCHRLCTAIAPFWLSVEHC